MPRNDTISRKGPGFVKQFSATLTLPQGLAEICDSYFMDALVEISEAFELSPDVAGATTMAVGTSAPEFFTSIVCTFFIPSNGGVGTIIGSAIFNIFVIVGATGVFACKQLKKERPDTNGVRKSKIRLLACCAGVPGN